MKFAAPQFLGLIYFISELLLSATRRSAGSGVRQDRSTLRMIWVVVLVSITAGLLVAVRWRAAALPYRNMFAVVGVVLFAAGIAVRWWAIVTLGRFFTVDVQIEKDHELVETGPFRFVRHPSYTGLLVAFVGFALSIGNWAALLVILVPIFATFVHRMNVEEQALIAALGKRYRSYMQRTKRLMPGVY